MTKTAGMGPTPGVRLMEVSVKRELTVTSKSYMYSCTKFLFSGCGLKVFPSLRGVKSKKTDYLLSYFSRLSTLKCNAKTRAVCLLGLNASKTFFFIL